MFSLFVTDDPPEHNYLYGLAGLTFIGGYGYLASTGAYPNNMMYLAASLCGVGALTGLSSQTTADWVSVDDLDA